MRIAESFAAVRLQADDARGANDRIVDHTGRGANSVELAPIYLFLLRLIASKVGAAGHTEESRESA